MGRCAQQIDVHVLDINRYMAEGLDRIGVEINAPFPTYGAKFLYGFNCSDLVVGMHDTDQDRPPRDGLFQVIGVDQPGVVIR